ncbi:MAG: hypothetical protein LAO05_13360, partial [Acidobacteriia bacterium]|nr:hypothetical protein [Terriglobia bacterium]
AVNPTNFDGLPTGNGWMLLVWDPSVFDEWFDDYNVQTYLFVKYNYGGYSTAVEGTEMANIYWHNGQFLPYLDTYDGLHTVFE